MKRGAFIKIKAGLKAEGIQVHRFGDDILIEELGVPIINGIVIFVDLFLEIGVDPDFYRHIIANDLYVVDAWALWSTPLGKSIMRGR